MEELPVSGKFIENKERVCDNKQSECTDINVTTSEEIPKVKIKSFMIDSILSSETKCGSNDGETTHNETIEAIVTSDCHTNTCDLDHCGVTDSCCAESSDVEFITEETRKDNQDVVSTTDDFYRKYSEGNVNFCYFPTLCFE